MTFDEARKNLKKAAESVEFALSDPEKVGIGFRRKQANKRYMDRSEEEPCSRKKGYRGSPSPCSEQEAARMRPPLAPTDLIGDGIIGLECKYTIINYSFRPPII